MGVTVPGMDEQAVASKGSASQVLHWVELGLAWLAWGGLCWAVSSLRGEPNVKIYISGAHRVGVVTPGQTIYQANPGAVSVILLVLALAVVAGTISLGWRAQRSVAGVGAAGLAAGVVACVFAVAGIMTIGPWIVPVAVLLVLVALPLGKGGRVGRG
jgi:hypothetical protein